MREVGNEIQLGLTPEALKKYGCVHVYIPRVSRGRAVVTGDILASLESSKALAPLTSPITGMLTGVNTAYVDSPHTIDSSSVLFSVMKV